MPFLPPNSQGKYLGVVTSATLDMRDDGGISINAVMGIMFQWNTETQSWEDVEAHDYQVSGFIYLRNGSSATKNPNTFNDKTMNTLGQIYDWYSGDFDELMTKIIESQEMIMGTVVDSKDGQYSNLKYIDVPREKPGRAGANNSDPDVVKSLTSKHKSEIKALLKRPTAPVQKFKPRQPEPNSQPWDTPARGTALNMDVGKDEVPF